MIQRRAAPISGIYAYRTNRCKFIICKAAAIVKPEQKLKANFWVCFFCKLQILKDVQSKSSPRSYSAKLKQSDVSSD